MLKKANLETILKNYRSVSNLSFMSKLVERAVVNQLALLIEKYALVESFQSAYRSALLRVKSDLLQAVDEGKVIGLLLLDLSAAFDAVDRSILLKRLKDRFGVSGLVLQWIKSYLHERCRRVVINGYSSAAVSLEFGCPREVFWGLFFSLYVPHHCVIYVEHMIFCSTSTLMIHNCIWDLNRITSPLANNVLPDWRSVHEIHLWMRCTCNMLKLNAEKTEFMLIGTRQQLAKTGQVLLKINEESIRPVASVCNLGFYMEKRDEGHMQVAKLCSTSYLMLRNIRTIRGYLDHDSAITLIRALIISRLDYCNSLMAGAPKYLLNRLQRIMNMACRVVYNLKKFDHITTHIKQLHWLKIPERIVFKIAVLVYKCKNE